MMKWLSGSLLLSVLLLQDSFPQDLKSPVVRFLFYNVENFFDTGKDTLKNDSEFLPGGLMRWNRTRYKKKVNSIYKTILAAGEWDAPAVIGFCEVENKAVLEELIFETYLNKHYYGIIHEESGDERGIDVCFIYRKDIVRLLSYKYVRPEGIREQDFRTRSVLYSKLLLYGDTIHLFLNHWPSKRGGALAQESIRYAISEMVGKKADSVSLSVNGQAKIVVAGDFNSTPVDNVISILTGKQGSGQLNGPARLVNLSGTSAGKGLGTYKYQGIWEMIDQVIVSDWLTRCPTGLYADEASFRIFSPEFLLIRDPVYPGFTPFSTYRGYKYQGGFSDHLPVILDLRRK
jgi:hypothetical protein